MLAERVRGRVIQNVNSTYTGGGVAEILTRIVPLLNQLDVDVRWSIIPGSPDFFTVTKKFHNALHGVNEEISDHEFQLFVDESEAFTNDFDVQGDLVVIHDPQPVMLVRKRAERDGYWVWRCHIDLSEPVGSVWDFLAPLVLQYDAAIFSAPQFARELPLREFFIPPSIDPLSDKNRDLPEAYIESVLNQHGIPRDKPIITQISRFDSLKDPLGLMDVFDMVRKSFDCRLVLAGGTADDDPESGMVLEQVMTRASDDRDVHVLLLPPQSDLEINAIQRGSDIIVQKSLREGFALTVSEALWKEKPVVASAVGGIPLQVKNRVTGLLSSGIEGTAVAIRQLLANPVYARMVGKNGREHVRQNFLITRHVRDYLLLLVALEHGESDIVHL